jgi:hypothetical protein
VGKKRHAPSHLQTIIHFANVKLANFENWSPRCVPLRHFPDLFTAVSVFEENAVYLPVFTGGSDNRAGVVEMAVLKETGRRQLKAWVRVGKHDLFSVLNTEIAFVLLDEPLTTRV